MKLGLGTLLPTLGTCLSTLGTFQLGQNLVPIRLHETHLLFQNSPRPRPRRVLPSLGRSDWDACLGHLQVKLGLLQLDLQPLHLLGGTQRSRPRRVQVFRESLYVSLGRLGLGLGFGTGPPLICQLALDAGQLVRDTLRRIHHVLARLVGSLALRRKKVPRVLQVHLQGFDSALHPRHTDTLRRQLGLDSFQLRLELLRKNTLCLQLGLHLLDPAGLLPSLSGQLGHGLSSVFQVLSSSSRCSPLKLELVRHPGNLVVCVTDASIFVPECGLEFADLGLQLTDLGFGSVQRATGVHVCLGCAFSGRRLEL